MLRTLLSKLWSKVQPTPEVAPEVAAAPPVVDNRTAFDRAVQRNPQLVPKGMTVAEFGVWCEEIGEKYEDALEFYSEVLVLKDPAEAKKIAAAHPDPGPDPVPVPHDPGPGPSPTDPGPDPGSRNVVPIPSRSQSRSRPGPDPGPTERDVVLDFVAWARRRVHPSRGYSPPEITKLYRDYCREADLEPLKTTRLFTHLADNIPGVSRVRVRVGQGKKDNRERRWHLPSDVRTIRKVA
jgi:hypothetical protein